MYLVGGLSVLAALGERLRLRMESVSMEMQWILLFGESSGGFGLIYTPLGVCPRIRTVPLFLAVIEKPLLVYYHIRIGFVLTFVLGNLAWRLSHCCKK